MHLPPLGYLQYGTGNRSLSIFLLLGMEQEIDLSPSSSSQERYGTGNISVSISLLPGVEQEIPKLIFLHLPPLRYGMEQEIDLSPSSSSQEWNRK